MQFSFVINEFDIKIVENFIKSTLKDKELDTIVADGLTGYNSIIEESTATPIMHVQYYAQVNDTIDKKDKPIKSPNKKPKTLKYLKKIIFEVHKKIKRI